MINLKYIRYILNLISLLCVFLIIFKINFLNNLIWFISLFAVFLLMILKPLDIIFPNFNIKKFMPLRKELGVLSAIIVVFFAFTNYFEMGISLFLKTYFSIEYWSGFSFFGQLGQLLGFILILTSNNFAKKHLGKTWFKIQKLSYIYFICGALYVFFGIEKLYGLFFLVLWIEYYILSLVKIKLKV